MDVRLTLNGFPRVLDCAPGESLLPLLRRAGCLSVRFGSASGETGAAAVLVDGGLRSADVLLGAQVDGHEVTTVESLDLATGQLHPIQAAFVETGALQSGYSAGAMVLAAKALLDRNPDPSEPEIRDALSGILDRETGYVKVVEAVRRAAALLRGEQPEPMQPFPVERLGDRELVADELSAEPAENVSPAVPRLVPSADAPVRTVVGKPVRKVDAVRLVKGKVAFTDDVRLDGMLYAKVLRSAHAHARIVGIDDAEARALPGVHAVLHCRNTPRVKYASGGQSWPNPHPWDQVSFDTKVRHVGDRVAAVAAETVELAEEACRRIKVTYEVLPAVFEPDDATAAGAPVIHDEDDSIGIPDPERNIAAHVEGQTVADIEAAFDHADRVFEQTLQLQRVQHCAIEPHVAIAWLDGDERLVLRTSTQVPFHVRRMLAPLLGLPVKHIRVIKPRVGGGFGGKQEMLIEDIVGHLALATRRPVRLELTREEEFSSARTRHPQTITFRSGVDAEGRLIAQDAAASAASRSAPSSVAVEGAGPERQGRRDQSLEHTAAAAADEAPRADAVEPTVRRPWRTRCGGPARATAAASRRRGTQRKGASADAPRARRHRHPGAQPSFETPHPDSLLAGRAASGLLPETRCRAQSETTDSQAAGESTAPAFRNDP